MKLDEFSSFLVETAKKRKMKILITLAVISLSCATIACQSDADRQAALDKAQADIKNSTDAFNYKIDQEYFGTLIDMVGQDQGESVGMKLLLDCKEKGYRVHMGTNGAPDVGDASQAYPPLSRRVIAECNSIIKTEGGIQSHRKAREAAEEKRKDAMYERTHPTN